MTKQRYKLVVGNLAYVRSSEGQVEKNERCGSAVKEVGFEIR